MKKYVIINILILFVLFSLSCKKNIESTNDKKNNEVGTNNIEKKDEKCTELFMKLIKKSSIKSPFVDSFRLSIDDIKNNQLTLKLYEETDNQENAIGWVIFDVSSKKLLDITNDIENPIILKYDKNIWNQIIDCYFNTEEKYKVFNDISECEEKLSEYESEQTCIYENISIGEVYKNTIKNKDITNTEDLLVKLPKNDTLININKDGLISIRYSIINLQKVNIEFLFEGGVNTLNLEQNKKGIKRVITTSAD